MELRKRIHEASASDWRRAYEVNVVGTFLPTRQVVYIPLPTLASRKLNHHQNLLDYTAHHESRSVRLPEDK
jgi:NADP-dependent 3-hydroxy acid dehydrogenase YdfG